MFQTRISDSLPVNPQPLHRYSTPTTAPLSPYTFTGVGAFCISVYASALLAYAVGFVEVLPNAPTPFLCQSMACAATPRPPKPKGLLSLL